MRTGQKKGAQLAGSIVQQQPQQQQDAVLASLIHTHNIEWITGFLLALFCLYRLLARTRTFQRKDRRIECCTRLEVGRV